VRSLSGFFRELSPDLREAWRKDDDRRFTFRGLNDLARPKNSGDEQALADRVRALHGVAEARVPAETRAAPPYKPSVTAGARSISPGAFEIHAVMIGAIVMAEAVKGVLHGNIITLDSDVPPLEGKRVRVLLEAVNEADAMISAEAHAELWREWIERGPQGPIEDGPGEPEFPS
jgi:hypothetical protein